MKPGLFLLFLFALLNGNAQSVLKVIVSDSTSQKPIVAATASIEEWGSKITDTAGIASFMLNPGTYHLEVTAVGFNAWISVIELRGDEQIQIKLQPADKSLEGVTLISSTRNNQRIENSPLKVEVLGTEEMDEESTIKPANLASILGDLSGVQIQQSSSVSGNANVRIQGLEGRYTQILRDGLPLFEGFSGGFGVLSIPPLDVKQVELIKGSASTLYGGGAIGGLVNIISRKPTTKQEGVFIINQSTLKETNFNTYFSKKYNKAGYTFFGGYTKQKVVDVNNDGFSDLPSLEAITIHPRLFFYPSQKTTITTGYTAIFEKRNGGDIDVVNGKGAAPHVFFEKNRTMRHSAELMLEQKLPKNARFELKSSLSSFDRTITTNSHYFNGNQLNYYGEASVFIPYGQNSFVGGINVVGDRFAKKRSDPVLINNFSNTTFGLFAQNTWKIKSTTFEAGLRDDYHITYGNFLLPRIAIFHRVDEHWAGRAGVGLGYKTPNPLTQQIVEYSIEKILPLAADVRAETSIGYNLEFNYKMRWDDENELFVNHAFFLTSIRHPLIVEETPAGDINFTNANRSVISKGFDTYIRAMIHEWELYAGYTFTIAERTYLPKPNFVPLTPKHRAAFTLVRDFEEAGWRMGLEGSYTGRQYRFNYTKTPGYLFIAAMIEKRFSPKWSMVLNGENLLDYRQSRTESLYTGSVSNPAFVPLWAPIDGRVVNLSVKYQPFAKIKAR